MQPAVRHCQSMRKTAVVVFNLGGPDTPEAIRPFLFNLFNDPAIIGLPSPLRWALAQLIAARRAPVAREIYALLGGGSPLLANTQAQASALQAELADLGDVRVFIAMRYWHPMAGETAAAVKAFAPDQIVLLPLYPQYSTTTAGSSVAEWSRAAAEAGIEVPTTVVCCYPTEPGFIAETVERLRPMLAEAKRIGTPRVLFSAHGLPKKIVARGDPYQWQVEQSAAAVVAALAEPDLDWVVCYQSRVGPLEWIGPATDAEVARAGGDGVPVVLVVLAFVSEHSETLVELDIEYKRLADQSRVPGYFRAPTVSVGAAFISGLAGVVRRALEDGRPLCSHSGERLCPHTARRCPHALK